MFINVPITCRCHRLECVYCRWLCSIVGTINVRRGHRADNRDVVRGTDAESRWTDTRCLQDLNVEYVYRHEDLFN